MHKTIFTIIFFTAACHICSAQVKIGANPATVNPAAVLELSNDTTAAPVSWKSFIPAYVNFSNPVFTTVGVWGIAGTPVPGAIVFNNAEIYTNGFSGSGLYCWLLDKWTPIVVSSVDKIRISLTTSRAAYDSATINSWVKITSFEYFNLAMAISGAAKYGTDDQLMGGIPDRGWPAGYTVGGSANSTKVPPSNYIIAWSVTTGFAQTSATGSKLKISGSQNAGYTDYGNPLPDIGFVNQIQRYYFVLKAPATITPSYPVFTAMYSTAADFLSYYVTNNPEYYNTSDNSSLPDLDNSNSCFQVIATPVKQW